MVTRQYLWRSVERLLALACVILAVALAGVLVAAFVAVLLTFGPRLVGNPDTPYLLPHSVDATKLARVDTIPVRVR